MGPIAHAMNELLLGLMAAWAIEPDTVITAYRSKHDGAKPTQSRINKLCQRVNRDEALFVMALLARRALIHPSRPELYTLGRLARIIGGQNWRSVENALRTLILPDLAKLGWIEGFEPRAKGDQRPYELKITEAGRAMYARFLYERCYAEIAPLIAELRDLGKPDVD